MRLKKIGILPILCLMALTAGVTYAIIQFYVDIPMTLEVVGVYELSITDVTGSDVVSIDIYNAFIGEAGTIGLYTIQNTGHYTVYLSYGLTGWPADVTLDVLISNPDMTPIGYLDHDTILPDALTPGAIMYCTLTYDVDPGASMASYAPTMRWNAHDSTIP